MKTKYAISGMTCEACVYKVEHLIKSIDGVVDAKADLKSNSLELESNQNLSIKDLQAVLPEKYKISKNELSAIAQSPENVSKLQRLKPLFIVFAYLGLGTLLASYNSDNWSYSFWMPIFMGLFFIAFSFFKMLDIESFVNAFEAYDVIAKRFRIYGYLFPFIELTLGIFYLVGNNMELLHWLTIIIVGLNTIGVAQSVLNKKQIQCACLGTVFNLPMTQVTIIENSIMLVMALAMLI